MQTEVDDAPEQLTVSPFLFPEPPSPLLQLTVIVPVRNEAHHLAQTLDALRNQLDCTDRQINFTSYEVLLLANNCTDQSYRVASQYQRNHPDFPLHIAQIQLPPNKANIGTVRRLLMDEAHRRLTGTGNLCGIIASTDGDTIVDRHWIYYIMLEIANGNDAVGGRILTHPESGNIRRYHLRNVLYRTLIARAEALIDPCPNDPWPRHFQHFGASIAVTCQMYEQAGRLPEKPFLEDEAFYKALLRTDAKVRQSPYVKVFTSTRTNGRVEVGFSEQLRYWAALDQSGNAQLVEPADAILSKLRNRRKLRLWWQAQEQRSCTDNIIQIAQDLQIDANWLKTEIDKSRFFGQLWEKVEETIARGPWAEQWTLVPITTAIQDLRTFIRS